MRVAALLLASTALLAAGCNAPDNGLTASSYEMHLAGVPSAPMAPGTMFNVTVDGRMGMGMGMHRMTSDHIGAHFWNRTMMDPTAALGDAMSCAHRGGEMPGQYTAMCTAPMEPGTYHLRAHARMADGHQDHGGMHHYWSGEQTFTVA
jgi:hypothetical protein